MTTQIQTPTLSALGHLPEHLPQIILTALSCQALMALADPLSRRLCGSYYTSLSKSRQIDWRSRVVSFIFATGILLGSVNMMRSKEYGVLRADKVFGYTTEGGKLAGFAAGYFVWDTVLCLRYAHLFGAAFLVHGIGCLTVMLFGLRPFLMYYGPRVLMFELSTPFLNINYWLDKFGLTGTKVQLVNGVVLLLAFFMSRIVWGWGLTYDFFFELYRRRHEVRGLLPWIFMVSNLILNTLNVYWFYMMVKSVAKRFVPKKDGGGEGDGGKDKGRRESKKD